MMNSVWHRAGKQLIYSAITCRYHIEVEEKPKNASWVMNLLASENAYKSRVKKSI